MKQYSEAEQQIHLAKLAEAYAKTIFYDDNGSFGAWGGDRHKPFGDSYGIYVAILEACGIDWTEGGKFYICPDEYSDYAKFLYKEKLGEFIKEAIAACSNLILTREQS